MKLRVTMENAGGELDSRVVYDGEDAMCAVLEMAEACGQLNAGDVFRVQEVE